MDFTLSEEQNLLVKTTESFVKNELTQHENLLEKTNNLPKELYDEIKKKSIEVGLYACNMPKEHGGGGLNAFDLTLVENLKAIAEILIKDDRERLSKINELIAKFELDAVRDIKAKFLSGGQRKKLVIALALLGSPKVLLLDECFAALDVLTIKMLQQVIVNLQAENNIGICICDHQARDLLTCVDVAIVLSNCKIIAKGTPFELIKDTNAKSAYFGESFKFH